MNLERIRGENLNDKTLEYGPDIMAILCTENCHMTNENIYGQTEVKKAWSGVFIAYQIEVSQKW